nr:BatA and WFA domain-containing protein [Saprospiraceae bacterium]
MAFLYPSFLWALLGLSIPIIIHLFFFKRFKKIYFSNTRLLKEIKEETSSRNRLKNLLVLIMRCLAIAALVFAFAQPFIPKSDNVNLGEKHVSLFIDNSFSMLAEQQNVPLLELAKQRAREIVNAYGPNDKFQILTHEFDGRFQRLISKDDALSTIDGLREVPSVNDLSNVLKRQNAVLKGDTRISYIISDFQKSISNIEEWQDSSMSINLIPIQSAVPKNVSIDSAWFDTPVPILNQNNKLLVKLKNHGDTEAEGVKITFTMDGQEKPVGVKSIPAKSTIVDSINVNISQSGMKQAKISILDYPILFDDEYYVAFDIPEKINILALNEKSSNAYLRALFSGISYFNLEEQFINQVQYQKFNDYQLIILNDLIQISSGLSSELGKYVRS